MTTLQKEYYKSSSTLSYTEWLEEEVYTLRNEDREVINDTLRYRESVLFTKTNQYGCGSNDEDDVYTVEEFKELVRINAFIDSDGFGHPVKDSKANPEVYIYPSRVSEIPSDATHIVWYNK